jgi:hypothetical protein
MTSATRPAVKRASPMSRKRGALARIAKPIPTEVIKERATTRVAPGKPNATGPFLPDERSRPHYRLFLQHEQQSRKEASVMLGREKTLASMTDCLSLAHKV